MNDFTEKICRDARLLFTEGTIDVLVAKGPGPGDDVAPDYSVKVVHIPSAISVICSDYPSQTENLIAALIKLKIACDATSK